MGLALSRLLTRSGPSEDAPRPAKRVRSADASAFGEVACSSESVTRILAFAGAREVLTLETLSEGVRGAIRGLALEVEGPTSEPSSRRLCVLANRAALFAARRAGRLPARRRLYFASFFAQDNEYYTTDVRYCEASRSVSLPSPRLVPTALLGDAGVDAALSPAYLDASERVREAVLVDGGVLLCNIGGNRRSAFRLVQTSRVTPPQNKDASSVAAAVEAMGGEDVIPRRLKDAATRDWTYGSEPGPDELTAVVATSVAAASGTADVATVFRALDALAFHRYVTNAGTFARVDETLFLKLCDDADVPTASAREIWSNAFAGRLPPFSPEYISLDKKWPREPGVVHAGDVASLEIHLMFILTATAHAHVARCEGDPVRCFAPEEEKTLKTQMPLLSSLGLAVLAHLEKLPDGAARVEAALASVTTVERLPLLAPGDKLYVAQGWQTQTLSWRAAYYSREGEDESENSIKVTYDTPEGPLSDAYVFGCQRAYALEDTPLAAQMLADAASAGRNDLLIRLLKAPALKEHALGFRVVARTAEGEHASSLDCAILSGNVVAAAILSVGGSLKGINTTVVLGARFHHVCKAVRSRFHVSTQFSETVRVEMRFALGLNGRSLEDLRWPLEPTSRPRSPLEIAAAAGDARTVRFRLAATTLRINVAYGIRRLLRRPIGDTFHLTAVNNANAALNLAVRRNDASVVTAILQSSEDCRLQLLLNQALRTAVFEGSDDCIVALLDPMSQALQQAQIKYTLASSATYGHAHVMRRLRESGYSLVVTADDPENGADAQMGPLDLAAQESHAEVIRELLLDSRVAAAVHAHKHTKACAIASIFGQHDCLRVLLDASDAFVGFDEWNWKAFAADVGNPLAHAVCGGHDTAAEVLLDYGFPVDGASTGFKTALMCAVSKGSLQTAEMLLLRGASIKPNDAPISALGWVFRNTQTVYRDDVRHQMVQLLFRYRRDQCISNLADEVYWTCLVLGNVETLELLLDAGADRSPRDPENSLTPLHILVGYVLEGNRTDHLDRIKSLIGTLIERGGDLDVPTTLLFPGFNVVTIPIGATPRQLASLGQHADRCALAESFIAAGIEKRDRGRAEILGRTPTS
mmetsp:Transcript_10798/g.33280  ORF Transcript_10798/g.33280 Transcript_10798/m.33280 type:complete len:1099 (+) Transcript_10798:2295-5591(+)